MGLDCAYPGSDFRAACYLHNCSWEFRSHGVGYEREYRLLWCPLGSEGSSADSAGRRQRQCQHVAEAGYDYPAAVFAPRRTCGRLAGLGCGSLGQAVLALLGHGRHSYGKIHMYQYMA